MSFDMKFGGERTLSAEGSGLKEKPRASPHEMHRSFSRREAEAGGLGLRHPQTQPMPLCSVPFQASNSARNAA